MIHVIGGTYKEINLDSISTEIFGSGLRCVKFLLENSTEVSFHTTGNDEVERYLTIYRDTYSGFNFNIGKIGQIIVFKYCFGLDEPMIYPNPQIISKTEVIEVEGENIVCFGMMESESSIVGSKVVYDPQTSINPKIFSDFGKASELVYIVNSNEAISLSGSEETNEIVNFFFQKEMVVALIIKDGPFGATVYMKNTIRKIPSYITENVFKLGSGDIFTSSFSYFWMEKNLSIIEAAELASKSTALFCDKLLMKVIDHQVEFSYKSYVPGNLKEKQVYIASPIFSLSDLILVDKLREVFLGFGLKVFSPFHDIGLGDESTIAEKDIEGLEESDIVFGVLDGSDSGTMVELGFSMAKEKKMIGYHRTINESSLLMLMPSSIKIYNNLTTAVYQTIWSL